MIILTARIPKKRLIAGAATVLCCGAVVAAALLYTLGGRAVTTSAEVKGVKSNEDRVAYLTGLGWQVNGEPLASEELLVPEEFDDSYTEYLALQSEQGFDLTQYRGKRIKRYTYAVTNHPSGLPDVQIALLVYQNRVIGGQVQSAGGGLLHGLSMPPAASPAPSPSPSPDVSPSPPPEPTTSA